MPAITFATAEAVLADLYRITDEHRIALLGRMKHFQRMNFPSGANPGRGRAAKLTFDELAQLTFAFELVQAGLPPMLARDTIAGSWGRMRNAIATVMSDAQNGDLWFIFHPETLRELTGHPHHFLDFYDDVVVCSTSELGAALASEDVPVVGERWRSIVISVRPVIGFLVYALIKRVTGLDASELAADLDRAAKAVATGDDE